MKIVRLSDGNQVELVRVIQQSTQLLPFFMTNSEARQSFLASLAAEDKGQQVAFESGLRLVGVVSYQLENSVMVINSLLLAPNQDGKGLAFWVTQLERLAKLRRAKTLRFHLAVPHLFFESRLQQLGYEGNQAKSSWQKELQFRTALVLAGGGARGAYQIGAWRALKELGIEFELIAGTSVGALNGGLILQGDIESAEMMWSQIDTGKILTFPGLSTEKGFSVQTIMKDVQHFALSAVANQGVSTEPLRQLIQDLLDEKKMAEKQAALFLVTTQLPQMREVVVSFKETPVGDFHRWLLASASFFPAMEATKIDGKYYVDGGYRNNIPVDVALKNGATEVIIIDVKGPGLTKPVAIPSELPIVTVTSPWSLGAVLLFDGSRSKWNIQLGYLETLKAFERYIGYWYSFDQQLTDQRTKRWQRHFWSRVLRGTTVAEKQLLRKPALISELRKKMRNLYQQEATPTLTAIYVLEFCGKILGLSPTVLYTVESMMEVIQAKLATNWLAEKPEEGMLLSLQEWLQLYADELPLPTDKQQVIFFYRQLKAGPPDQMLLSASGLAPLVYLAAKTLIWLEKEKGETRRGTRI